MERYGHHNFLECALTTVKSEDGLEPSSYKEAMEYRDSIHLKEVMEEEIRCLYKNNTRKLMRIHHDHMVVECKWVYKMKAISEDGG